MGNATKNDGALGTAARRWIIAEYQFRYGPRAYQNDTTAAYEKACRKLRRALTGKKDVGDAYKTLHADSET